VLLSSLDSRFLSFLDFFPIVAFQLPGSARLFRLEADLRPLAGQARLLSLRYRILTGQRQHGQNERKKMP